LRRKLTPEQRLSGLKTTEAAEFAKLTRIGRDAYLAEKRAELDPKIDALIAELKEQQKNKKGV
jgi:iron uptake system EfeUOB component EfeO/EfeM